MKESTEEEDRVECELYCLIVGKVSKPIRVS